MKVEILGEITPEYREILTPDALEFLGELAEKFTLRRNALLELRKDRQARFDAGEKPDFLPETKEIRESSWKIRGIPQDILDRRVEITGPVERKMVINALNSGAKVFMADFEDAHSPTWHGSMQGQINMRDAVAKTIEFTSPDGKQYRLNDKHAVLFVRPRGWHLDERYITHKGIAVPAALVDFGLYFYHNVKKLLENNTGPYFYLPKLESHLEARLWNDIFIYAQDRLGIPQGTIKATVLIETITATFELNEILWELKDHIVALNCGRWDYIFSYIKKLRKHSDVILPDRSQVVMTVPFLRAYSKLVIQTCHKRGAFAMGGMAAQIPIKNDEAANSAALARVRADKEREAGDGHDGTWVAHPALVPIAMEVFDKLMPTPNQIHRLNEDFSCSRDELLAVPDGTITEGGVRNNIAVSLRYLASWLGGLGCVPIFNLMEDAATAEISRTQLWQWLHHPKGILEDGRKFNQELFEQLLADECVKLHEEVGGEYETKRFQNAISILRRIVLADELQDFLTLPAYDLLMK